MSDWIAAQFRRAIEQTVAGYGDWCVNLNSKANTDHWVQITWEHLNLSFPLTVDPESLIAELPAVPDLEIVDSKPNSYLTLAHGADFSLPAIADFVAEYAERYLGEMITSDTWTVSEEAL